MNHASYQALASWRTGDASENIDHNAGQEVNKKQAAATWTSCDAFPWTCRGRLKILSCSVRTFLCHGWCRQGMHRCQCLNS